jgi:hypothetical protein
MMDAGRWTTVATAVAEHLGAVENAIESHHSLPPAPVGALAAAEQFFTYVLLALDQPPAVQVGAHIGPSSAPTMAGISSLSIAVTVMRKAQGDVSPNLQKVREQVNAFTRTLKALKERQVDNVQKSEVSELMEFFNQLGRAGRIDRAATIAMQERPNV